MIAATHSTELSSSGLVFMLVVWAIVLVLMIWSYTKILTAPPKADDGD